MPKGFCAAAGPDLTVAAIVENDGRFLLVEERVAGRRVINQPAGHVESGESLRDAVIRETLEETGWHFQPEAVSGIYLWAPEPGAKTFLRVAFAGSCASREPGRALDQGIIGVCWLSHQELVDRSAELRSPMVLRAVEDYLRGSRRLWDSVQALDKTQLAQQAAVL